jgi:hypothetical protein
VPSAAGECSRLFDGRVLKYSSQKKKPPFEVSGADVHEVEPIMNNQAPDALQVLRMLFKS